MTRLNKNIHTWRVVGPLLVLGVALLWSSTDSVQAEEKSSCISCHTSVKELVRITRELAAKKPAVKSEEISGEG